MFHVSVEVLSTFSCKPLPSPPPQALTLTPWDQMRPSSSISSTALWVFPSPCSSSPSSPTSSSLSSPTLLSTTCTLTGVCPTPRLSSSTPASSRCSSSPSSSSSLPSWSVWWSQTGASWMLCSAASSSWAPLVREETLWGEPGAQWSRRHLNSSPHVSVLLCKNHWALINCMNSMCWELSYLSLASVTEH